jgi:hypothetical protein
MKSNRLQLDGLRASHKVAEDSRDQEKAEKLREEVTASLFYKFSSAVIFSENFLKMSNLI